MAGEPTSALRQTLPLSAFLAFAAVALLCEVLGYWLSQLLFPSAGRWLGIGVDAVLAGAGATLLFHGVWRPEMLRRDQEAKALLTVTPAPLALVGRDAVVGEANPAARTAFEGGRGALEGRGLFESLDAEAARDLNINLKEAFRSGRPVHFERAAEGHTLRVDALPLLDSDGQVSRLAVHCQDVTEQVLQRTSETLAGEIDRRVAGCEDVVGALQFVCAELVSVMALRMAWIGRKEDNGAVSVITCHGIDMDCEAELRRAGVRWDDTPPGRGPVGVCIRSGNPQIYKGSESGAQDWQKTARRFGIKSMLAVPLRVQGVVHGALVLCARRANAFDDPPPLALADVLAVRIGSALAAATDRQQLRLFTTGLEAAANGIFITSRAGVIEWANQAFCRLCGWTRSEVIGRNPRFLKSGQQDAEFYQALWSTILAGDVWSATTIERRKDGSLYVAQQTITPIKDFRGEISHFISVHEDITAMRETEERLHHMAQYDTLTDLPNRALFFDRLGLSLAVARRNHHSVALLYVDLDHFKTLNDTFGHRLADAVLQQVAVRLKRAMRESDTVARVAGDEFCIIAPQILVRDDAARVAQKCLESLKTPIDVDGESIRVSVSIGIAIYPHDGESPETLIQRADAAMTIVKMTERNNYKFSSVI